MTVVPPTSRGYAAIKISRDTLHTIMASASDSAAGVERLVYALWRFPYKAGVDYYFVGGNFLKLNLPYPDFSRQILTKGELDLLFTYNKPKARPGQRDPDVNWFPARLKEVEIDEVMG